MRTFGFYEIPPVIGIEDYDVTVVLSNVLQNALFTACKLENGKVDLNINYLKGVLYISIENDFDGTYIYIDGNYQTTRSEKENHGFGLSNVKTVVEKYDGKINIRQKDRKFSVDILLYMKTDDKNQRGLPFLSQFMLVSTLNHTNFNISKKWL